MHHQLTAVVQRVAGRPIRPSYVYLGVYREGAVLEPHVDREQCELSVTLLLEFQGAGPDPEPWPLWLRTPGGDVAISQAVGDALVYRGRTLPHWRTALGPQGRSMSLFFHYVDADFSGPLR